MPTIDTNGRPTEATLCITLRSDQPGGVSLGGGVDIMPGETADVPYAIAVRLLNSSLATLVATVDTTGDDATDDTTGDDATDDTTGDDATDDTTGPGTTPPDVVISRDPQVTSRDPEPGPTPVSMKKVKR